MLFVDSGSERGEDRIMVFAVHPQIDCLEQGRAGERRERGIYKGRQQTTSESLRPANSRKRLWQT